VTVSREKPVGSATSLTVYAGFKGEARNYTRTCV
jgi:hypothetical protein